MKKKTTVRIISIILVVIAVFAAVCAASVKGGGFLDLSNIVRIPCICMAVICAVSSVILWIYSGRK